MKSFDSIYKEHHQTILNLVKYQWKVKDDFLAQEITNDAFVTAFKKIEMYDESKSKFITWIGTIAKNLVVDAFRKRKIQYLSLENNSFNKGDNDKPLDITDWLKSDESNPEEELIGNEKMNQIQRFIDTLKPKNKTVFDLYYIKGLSYTEIAEQLSVPLGTIKARLHHVIAGFGERGIYLKKQKKELELA